LDQEFQVPINEFLQGGKKIGGDGGGGSVGKVLHKPHTHRHVAAAQDTQGERKKAEPNRASERGIAPST